MNKDWGTESKIGIMCATAREPFPYLSVMQIRKTDECAMHSFHDGTIKDICTTAVCSGCGKINASITAQLLIDRYDVDAIIFSGIAGGMRKEVKIFDTVVCTASSFHDTDNEIYTDFPVMKAPVFYADDRLTALAKEAAGRMGRKYILGLQPQGTGIWSRSIRTHCALIWKLRQWPMLVNLFQKCLRESERSQLYADFTDKAAKKILLRIPQCYPCGG